MKTGFWIWRINNRNLNIIYVDTDRDSQIIWYLNTKNTKYIHS
jgi:hypothetical protein